MAAKGKQTDEQAAFRVRLVDGVNAAQFNLGGEEIELTEADPVLAVDNQQVFKSLLEHPFLEEA